MPTLTSSGTFNVAAVAAAVAATEVTVYPGVGYPSGNGRLVHPALGAFDYQTKPDSWVNMDGDVIVMPTWASTGTLGGAASALWAGDISRVVCEEKWAGAGGISMPISQLRMLLAIITTPVDPANGYVEWYPSYVNANGYQVIPADIVVGSVTGSQMARFNGVGQSAVELDDIIHALNVDGSNNGWVSKPVSVLYKMVAKL